MQTPPPGPAHSRLALTALAFSVLPFLSWGACWTGAVDDESLEGMALWIVSCVLSLTAAAMGMAGVIRGKQTAIAGVAFGIGLLSPVVTFFLGAATLNISWTSGRPLLRRGRARLPEVATNDGWSGEALPPIPGPTAAADAWRQIAATEAASVAAFSHLSNELVALGAPSAFVEHAHADALDEVRHARLCYAVATAIDGRVLGAGAFPEALLRRDGPLTVKSLAASTVVEACVLEAASALVAGALVQRKGQSTRIAAVLETIFKDESRHAEHGWEILQWCLRTGGDGASVAAQRALDAIDPSRVSAPVSTDELEPFGVPGPELWRASVRQAQLEARLRLAKLTADPARWPPARRDPHAHSTFSGRR